VDRLPDRILNRQNRENALTALHTISHLDANRSIAIKHYVHPRAEFYQAHSLAALYPIANFVVENDAARNEAGNLFEDHGAAISLDGYDVLLVLIGGIGAHRVEKFAALIANFANDASDRRAIHVHVENIKKNADPAESSFAESNLRDVGYLTVSGDTTAPGKVVIERFGSRKNHRKNAASSKSGRAKGHDVK
jgi:hypothetical protein